VELTVSRNYGVAVLAYPTASKLRSTCEYAIHLSIRYAGISLSNKVLYYYTIENAPTKSGYYEEKKSVITEVIHKYYYR
jgi:hypothetical protein